MTDYTAVLIVDDDAGTRETLGDVLALRGYRVVAAASGQEALRQLGTGTFDVAIVDIKLPDLSGLDLLTAMKQVSDRTEVIFVTAYASVSTAIQAINGAAFGYVTKPFEMELLLATLHKAVEKLELARARATSEQALRESEQWFRATFEQAAIGIGQMDLDGRYVRVNDRLCAITGYDREELLATRFQDITHPDDRDPDRMRGLLAAERPSISLAKRYRRRDGTPVWVEVAVSLMRDGAGQPRYFVAMVQDITERKTLEQEFLHAQRLEGLGQLAGGIAHDFNNLLTVIAGRSQLAVHRLAEDNPARRDLDLIHRTSTRAAMLTRQLLAFSRKQVLQPRVLDVNSLIEGATALLKRLIGEDVDPVFVPAPDVGRVRADPGQLEQVIINLAVNARDAMPTGGQLTITTANQTLDRAYAARHVDVTPGPHVVITVTDTGTGMDRATQARIFEPFFTTKEHGKGTGLGLSTVYGIVKQSGGHIRVYSEPGRGTTFRIYLPRTDAAPDEEIAPTSLRGGTETVLLVEDDDEVRAFATEALDSLGYRVLEARTPEEGLQLSERHHGVINLLVTDVVMPGMNGRVLAESLTASRPETKVLFMSGYTDDAIIRHGILEADIVFLEKPFTTVTLAQKVREALDRPG